MMPPYTWDKIDPIRATHPKWNSRLTGSVARIFTKELMDSFSRTIERSSTADGSPEEVRSNPEGNQPAT